MGLCYSFDMITARKAIPFLLLATLSLACTCSGEELDGMMGASEPAEPAAPAAAFDPSQPGTRALAPFQDSGFAYAAVTTGIRAEDGRIHVVYADGDTEVVPQDSLFPDSIGPGTRVEARIRSWAQWYSGEVQRRVGHAVFVRFDDGDEEWTSIGLVRIPVQEVPRDAPQAAVAPPGVPAPQPGSRVVANFQRDGWFYPAVVAETRDDGQVHVIYADGDSEWLPPSEVRADPIDAGAEVQASPDRGDRRMYEAQVVRRVGHAVEVRLDGDTTRWAALARVRVR